MDPAILSCTLLMVPGKIHLFRQRCGGDHGDLFWLKSFPAILGPLAFESATALQVCNAVTHMRPEPIFGCVPKRMEYVGLRRVNAKTLHPEDHPFGSCVGRILCFVKTVEDKTRPFPGPRHKADLNEKLVDCHGSF